VRTRALAIQFGMPPETIKDSMALGLEIPQTFVVPPDMFDRRRGLSVAEFEFPSYYNFFALKRRARLVVEAGVEARVRAVFQETLFGPASAPAEVEYAGDYPLGARPDFARESEYFRSVPGRRRLDVDDLVQFLQLKDGRVELGQGIVLASHTDGYQVLDGAEQVARVRHTIELPGRTSGMTDVACAAPDSSRAFFHGPAFGVTVLGASHGFDPAGKTTGFLLWMGGRALLIDPPTDSTAYLREHGVSPKNIDGVILTHCHADHDAGTFQKLLEEGQVRLFTTPHILGSFLRKYSALSGLSQDTLRRTFEFNPVRIGSPVHIRGGELWFRYKLHSIPTIGLEAFYGGQSIAISADTLYEPERIHEMHERGVLAAARRDELLAFPSHHQLNLHEAGIAPLHTPASALLALTDAQKANLVLVHIASKDVPAGLTPAKVGLEHTYRLHVETPQFADAIARLDAFAMVDFLRELPLARARALLQVSRTLVKNSGDKILEQGTRGESFYVIESGTVAVVRNEIVLKRYTTGDYFGETALISGQPRRADVVAETQVELLVIERDDFFSLLRGSKTMARLQRLARGQAEGTWELITKNPILSKMSSAQKTQLETFFTPVELTLGQRLWNEGEVPNRAFLIDRAIVVLEGTKEERFQQGAFLGDFDALLTQKPATSSARTTQAGRAFCIEEADLTAFFADNPGALLSFIGARFCE
jgi:CRP-like cAMP-binding protein/phosphoribosyl 1,2-cyclic phosphodiesterase